ncbi:MAG: SPFH domain-containing protein [Patescibacteria group bacterium]|nr:SPFH domain-containing protein [Patescibacteria group bacterium]
MKKFFLILSVLIFHLWVFACFGALGIIVLDVALAGLFLFVYFILASSNIFFTFVKEGTTKAIMKAGESDKFIMRWKGHIFDFEKKGIERWNIIRGTPKERIFGGLFFIGFWPIYTIYKHKFQWTGVKEDGTIEHHPEEDKDSVMLLDDIYLAIINKAEDKNLLPLTVAYIMTIRVKNPYKILFAVEKWLETIINQTSPTVRDSLTSDVYQNLIANKMAIGTKVYNLMSGKDEKPHRDAEEVEVEEPAKGSLIDVFQRRYGVDLRKIQIKEIDPSDEYRDITLLKYTAEQEKKERKVNAEADKIYLKAVSSGIGELLKEKDASNQEIKDAFLEMYSQQMSINGNALTHIKGGKGNLEDGLMKVFSAFNVVGRKTDEQEKEKAKIEKVEEKQRKEKKMTEEEMEKFFLQ